MLSDITALSGISNALTGKLLINRASALANLSGLENIPSYGEVELHLTLAYQILVPYQELQYLET